jgi:hypothetical protein
MAVAYLKSIQEGRTLPSDIDRDREAVGRIAVVSSRCENSLSHVSMEEICNGEWSIGGKL